jgi:hypothetical protein
MIGSLDGYNIAGENADALDGLLRSCESILTAKREEGQSPRLNLRDPLGISIMSMNSSCLELLQRFWPRRAALLQARSHSGFSFSVVEELSTEHDRCRGSTPLPKLLPLVTRKRAAVFDYDAYIKDIEEARPSFFSPWRAIRSRQSPRYNDGTTEHLAQVR